MGLFIIDNNIETQSSFAESDKIEEPSVEVEFAAKDEEEEKKEEPAAEEKPEEVKVRRTATTTAEPTTSGRRTAAPTASKYKIIDNK